MWNARFGMLLTAVTAVLPAFAADDLASRTIGLVEVPQEYRLDGTVEAVHQSTVSAQTSGQVVEILFEVDDIVQAGDLIARLKDTDQQAGLARSEAELKAAEARLKETGEAFARTEKMHARQLVADAAMDSAAAALDTAAANTESARAAVEQAREQLDHTRIRAPYSGIVTERHVQVGETANPGQAVMSGISLDALRVVVDVPQSLVPMIREKEMARVLVPGDGSVSAEKIVVFPYADQGTSTFKVRLDLPRETKNLFPGMFVKTAFLTGMAHELVVPGEAVVRRSEVTGVYVLDDAGGVNLRYVRLGHQLEDGSMVVLSGLEPGERVALDPVAAGVAIKRGARPGGGEKDRTNG